ncbi:MAG: hypothetical protein ACK55I_00795, partial [bacterium]
AHGDAVALAEGETLDAEPGSLGGDGGDGAWFLREVTAEIGDGARHRLRHFETGARRHHVVFDSVVGHPEAVIGAHGFIGGADLRVVGQPQALLVGGERLTPEFPRRKALSCR